uniref:Killer cell lectin like receptor D1 n=1 Tax=Aotus nancymaae TaxID=37293 RepID=A0A2K5CR82_AOTNA
LTVFKATFWRLISGTLGIICLSLMATLGILLKNSFTKLSIESAFTPGPNIELQKGFYELQSTILLDWTLL